MASQSQISANRQNAQKSTGPQTPEGKAAIAQNALKHGLTAVRDVVVTENQEDFDLHRDALLEELAPQGQMERILADRIVSLSWRLRRAGYIQNQAIDVFNERISTRNENPNLTLGRIALRDFYNEKVIDRLMMYERRIENSLYKTTLELKKLKQHPYHQQIPESPRPRAGGYPRPGTTLAPEPTTDPIINIESPAEPRLTPGPVPGAIKDPIVNNHSPIINTPAPPYVPLCLCHFAPFLKNKPNPKTKKTNITPANTNTYNKNKPPKKEQKQTQSNPIPAQYDIRLPQGGHPKSETKTQSIKPGTTSETKTQTQPNPTSDIRNPKSDSDRSEIPMNIGIRSTLKALRHIT